MTQKKPADAADDDSLGVLDDAASPLDTAGIGILGTTAQVNVTLPRDEDDELADDEVVGGELISDLIIDEAPAADASSIGRIREGGGEIIIEITESSAPAEIAESSVPAEIVTDPASADAEPAAAEPAADAAPAVASVEPVSAAAAAQETEAKSAAGKTAAGKGAPGKSVSGKSVSGKSVSGKSVSGKSVSGKSAAKGAAGKKPKAAAKNDSAKNDSAKGDSAVADSAKAASGTTATAAASAAFAAERTATDTTSGNTASGSTASGSAASGAAASDRTASRQAPSEKTAADTEQAKPVNAGDRGPLTSPASSQSAASKVPVSTEAARTTSFRPASTVSRPAAPAPAPVASRPAEKANTVSTHQENTPKAAETGSAPRPASAGPDIVLSSKRLGELGEASRESADLLTADRLLDPHKVAKPEPEGAWSHFLYTISGRRINIGDGKRARARKALSAKIAAPLAGGARFVPVLSRKGGVGKTTITALLGMALADARDDRVIAVDANPDRGTLAERIVRSHSRSVRDLVRIRDDVKGYHDISAIVARDATRLDVLASDSDPRIAEAFDDSDYRDVAGVAAHYYSLVLTDTGTGIVHSVMGATLDLADQLIIVSGLSVDEARLASETLTWLETNGHAELAREAIIVLNQSTPGSPLVRLNELEAHFSTRAKQVVRMPYDSQIAGGGAIVFANLQPETRQAARELAALLVEGLRARAS